MRLPVPMIRIVGKSNGVGLARDIELMAAALGNCGARVEVVAADRRAAKLRRSRIRRWWRRVAHTSPVKLQSGCDLNVMLEHAWPQYMSSAKFNVLVPNPEWCDRHDLRQLAGFDQIWAKTRYTRQIFEDLSRPTFWIGFDSVDRYDSLVPRERRFLHLAGKSTMKGTARLLETWARHPRWPMLTVVQSAARVKFSVRPAPNIQLLKDYLDDQELRRIQNACQFHICTSEAEGWGHYIVEAMSVAAVVVTLDGPPMNELVSADRGILLPCVRQGRQNLSALLKYDSNALAVAVERALQMTPADIMAAGDAAREWMVTNKSGFPDRLRHALAALGV